MSILVEHLYGPSDASVNMYMIVDEDDPQSLFGQVLLPSGCGFCVNFEAAVDCVTGAENCVCLILNC